MKVLISAYGCEPGRGSEAGVGWNCVQQAARFYDVWVLTQDYARQGINAALASDALPRVKFVYLDLPAWALFWKETPWGVQIHYYLWQLAAYFVGRRLHRKVGFDLIHHVTLVKYWMPSFLALLPVPFIWGPVGGGESSPRAFRYSLSLRGRIFEVARDLARKLGECDPFVRLTARKAALGLATTEETAKRMRMLRCRRVSVLTQVGLPLVCIIHECAGQRGFEVFGAGCSWSWRSAGRRRRLSSVADRLGARVWLIPSTLLPGSGAAPKRERIRGRELRGYPLKAPKARAI